MFMCLVSCDGNRSVTVTALKNGSPIAGVEVKYTEANSKLDSISYVATTDAAGSATFNVEIEGTPLTYYLSVPTENGGEDIARGGFSGGRRVAQWNASGYDVTFK